MNSKALLFLPLMLAPLALRADVHDCNRAASGYVSSVHADGSFVVRGVTVHPNSDVRYIEWAEKNEKTVANPPPTYIGEGVEICGVQDKKARTVQASTIWFYPRSVVQVQGSAMIGAVKPSAPGIDQHAFRADGYWLHVDGKTVLHLEPPLTSIDQVGANVWMDYRGVQQTDGTVQVDEAFFQKNAISDGEQHYNSKREFGTSESSNGNKEKQGAVSQFFLPLDHSRLMTHDDEELALRVTRIGEGLVPAYQRALPKDDPTRVDFRFQIVDAPGRYWYPMPQRSGIIQLPYKGVKRLKNDAQIAAEIAEAMGAVLEQQEYRHRVVHNGTVAASWAAQAGGLFVPGLGLAGLGPGLIDDRIETAQQKQSARVGLCLMHDAGYDLTQAPIAWQLLKPNDEKPLDQIKPSKRADYLYEVIGRVWSEPALP